MDSSKEANETESMDKYMHTGHDGLTTQGDVLQRLLAMIYLKLENWASEVLVTGGMAAPDDTFLCE